MVDLGKQHKTAEALYLALKEKAHGGRRLSGGSVPDWSGRLYAGARRYYLRPRSAAGRITDGEADTGIPDKAARSESSRRTRALEWDPISTCSPPGHPRWLTEPFLRDFIVTPDQTYLINEMMNDIRRIYTDGRGHIPEADRYPLYNGDSIGFWDGDRGW